MAKLRIGPIVHEIPDAVAEEIIAVKKERDDALLRLSSGFEHVLRAFCDPQNQYKHIKDAIVALRPDAKINEDEGTVNLSGGHSSTAEREPCGAFVSNDPDLYCRLANDHDGDHEWLARRDGKCSAESHELLRRAGEAAGLTHHTCGRCGESLDRAGEGRVTSPPGKPEPCHGCTCGGGYTETCPHVRVRDRRS